MTGKDLDNPQVVPRSQKIGDDTLPDRPAVDVPGCIKPLNAPCDLPGDILSSYRVLTASDQQCLSLIAL